jgi:hypothetical protein
VSFFFADSFDLYGNAVTDPVLSGNWDSTSSTGNTQLVAGRFPGGNGLAPGFSSWLNKSSGVNDACHHFILGYTPNGQAVSGSSLGICVALYDGATAQCTVEFRTDGAIVLCAGARGGTILATYAGAFVSPTIWNAYEIEVVIDPTAGSFTVRKNGNTVNDFQATGLNTRATANSQANSIQLSTNANVFCAVDDFIWRSGATGAVPWWGDVRCYMRRPNTDVSAQWTRSGSTFSCPAVPSNAAVNTGSSPTAGYGFYTPIISPGGTIGGVSVTYTAAATCNIKCALFTSSAGKPGAIIQQAAAPIANPVAGVNIFTFFPVVTIAKGTQFWIGIVSDTTVTNNLLYAWNIVPWSTMGLRDTSPTGYAAWPVNNPIAGTVTGSIAANLIVTPSNNADLVCDQFQDGSGSYLADPNVGDADLYSLQPLLTTPASVFACVTRALVLKSDSGTRGVALNLKSGATNSPGSSQVLNSAVWTWLNRVDFVDPATGAAWTPSAVNALQIGQSVSA